MKRFSKLFLGFFLASVLVFNFSYADNSNVVQQTDNQVIESSEVQEETTKKGGVPFEVEGTANVNTENLEEGIENIADKGGSLAYTIVQQISDKSLPVCAILILWGAVLYFILGIRNLYKKRQGLLLMWGAFTFVVIAKIMNFAFWFAIMR